MTDTVENWQARWNELSESTTTLRRKFHQVVAERDALKVLLVDIRPYVYGLDNIKRIDEALK